MRGRILLFFIVCSLRVLGQKEADNWYFGNKAGVNFSNGVPVVLSDNQISTFEGTSSISDSKGNLLFYTNGINVYDRDQNLIDGGLNGNYSSAQSSLIIPNPGNSAQYYIFTTDAFSGPMGLQYSVVDMNLRNGKGGLILKNRSLITPVAEMVTACRIPGSNEYWVITHEGFTDRFVAYKVNEYGIDPNPVFSNTGLSFKETVGIGTMKISPGCSRIAVTLSENGTVQLFKFNPATGKVSDPKLIFKKQLTYIYGSEFSPAESKLYVSGWDISYIIQFDLNAADIAGSMDTIQTGVKNGIGQLQLGPDHKIYVCRSYDNYLDYIEFPDREAKNSAYNRRAIFLGTNCTRGLPGFPTSVFLEDPICGKTAYCKNDTGKFFVLNPSFYGKLTWKIQDNAGKTLFSCSDSNLKHVFTREGMYTLLLITENAGNTHSFSRVIQVHEKPLAAISGKNMVCSGDTFHLGTGIGKSYRWSTGDTTKNISFASLESQVIKVTVSNEVCSSTDSVRLYLSQRPDKPEFQNSYSVCQHATLQLKPLKETPNILHWYDLTGKEERNGEIWNMNTSYPGTRILYCANNNGYCESQKTRIQVNILPSPEIKADDTLSFTLSEGAQKIDLKPGNGILSGKGVTGHMFNPSEAGEGLHLLHYKVEGAYHCTSEADIKVKVKKCCGPLVNYLQSDVYPNPGNGLFKICPESELAHALQMRVSSFSIYSSEGQKVMNTESLSSMVSGEFLDLQNLQRGTYVLELVTYEKTYIRRLVIE